jgi:hypothetical protein
LRAVVTAFRETVSGEEFAEVAATELGAGYEPLLLGVA